MPKNPIRVSRVTFAVTLSLVAAPLASAQELLIGQVAALTNPATTANAKGIATGLQAYFSYVNDHGGVGGRQVKLVSKDDGSRRGKWSRSPGSTSPTRRYLRSPATSTPA